MSLEETTHLEVPLVGEPQVPSSPTPTSPKYRLASIGITLFGCTGVALFSHGNLTSTYPFFRTSLREYQKVETISGDDSFLSLGYSVGISKLLTNTGSESYVITGSPKHGYSNGVAALWKQDGELEQYKQVDVKYGASSGDEFGTSMGVDVEGDLVAVGAIYENGFKGCVHSYSTAGGKLSEQERICGESNSDEYGASVSVVAGQAGKFMAVGAPCTQSSGKAGYVKVYMYEGYWAQVGNAVPNSDKKANFGASVKMSSGGKRVIVGTPNRNMAQVFEIKGKNWRTLGSPIEFDGASRDDGCGKSVDISLDGSVIVVGCAYFNKVKTFTYDSNDDEWVAGQDLSGQTGFGYSLSMDTATSHLLIGSPYESGGKGKCYKYISTGGNKGEGWKLESGASEAGTPGSKAGWSVAMSPDASHYACGRPYANVNGQKYAGSVTVHENPDI